VDSLCPCRRSSPLGSDAVEATGGRSVSCRRPGRRQSFCGLVVSVSSRRGSNVGKVTEERSVPFVTVKLLL